MSKLVDAASWRPVGILDRFWRALPEPWKLTRPYKIVFGIPYKEYADFQRQVADEVTDQNKPSGWANDLVGGRVTRSHIFGVNKEDFDAGINELELGPLKVDSLGAFLQLARLRWAFQQDPILLTFAQIGRLAQLIVATNPAIKEAFHATYSHLFVDEFQDTTGAQYGLMRSIFAGTSTQVTAVGDDKQKIMGWAGAMKESFKVFTADFLPGGIAAGQEHLPLLTNRRSNARIVEILNVLKYRLAPGEPDFLAKRPAPPLPPEQICAVVISPSEQEEAEALGEYLARRLAQGKSPRDMALLVRQKPGDWEDQFAAVLAKHQVFVRNEDRNVAGAAIQDLVSDPYPNVIVDVLELLTRKRGGSVWAKTYELLCDLDAAEEGDEAANKIAADFDKFITEFRLNDAATPISFADVGTIIDKIESFIGLGKLQTTAPHYMDRPYFDLIRGATKAFIGECIGTGRPLLDAIAAFRGETTVPLMTITKSKGLEYDIVILLGLDDEQWWSFKKNPDDAHSNFFVAASRAKDQLFMTYSGKGISKVGEVIGLLKAAGVKSVKSAAWAKT